MRRKSDLMAKLTDPNNTNVTSYHDFEFDRRARDVERVRRAVAHFDRAMNQGMVAMKEIASAFEGVGQAFTELTVDGGQLARAAGADVNPYPTEADMENLEDFAEATPPQQRTQPQAAHSIASTRLTEEATSQVRHLAKMFADESRRINEGQPFQAYNTGMHRDVVTRLRPVDDFLKSADESRHKRTDALKTYNKYKAEVEKIEKQCVRKGKPFSDSKSHKKYAVKRDTARAEYQARNDKFNEVFAMLMEVNDHAAAQVIHRYLALNHEYLQQLVTSLGRILPAMEEAYPLNSEYSTVQNSLIVEAVAHAKTPFADHHAEFLKQNQAPLDGFGPEEEEDDEEADEEGAAEEAETSLTYSSSTGREVAAMNSKNGGALLEEPADEDPDHRGGAGAHQPIESNDNPHEPDAMVSGAAHSTAKDAGYVLSQPGRLRTGSASEGAAAAPIPGSVDAHKDPEEL